MRSRYLPLLVFLVSASAVVIDRTAVVVDRVPILDSDITREIRITAFLNQEVADFSEGPRKQAASRLIDQQLIRQQIRLGGYAIASKSETDQLLAEVKHEHFGAETQFEAALTRYGITDLELRDHLSWELTVLRFIDTMFRPQVVVSDHDVEEYYAANRSRFDSKSLAQVRPAIVETMTGQKINTLFDSWLAQTRKSARIVYLEKSLA